MDTGPSLGGRRGPKQSGSQVTDMYSASASPVCLGEGGWGGGLEEEVDPRANYPSWVALSGTLGTRRKRAGLSGQAGRAGSRPDQPSLLRGGRSCGLSDGERCKDKKK